MWLTVVKKYKTKLIYRKKSNKLWEIDKISKVKLSSMILWSLKNYKKREKSCNSFTKVLASRKNNLSMINLKRVPILNKISILKLLKSFQNILTSRLKSMLMILNTWGWSMDFRRRESSKQWLMKERCSWESFKRNMKIKRDSYRLWIGLKMKTRM